MNVYEEVELEARRDYYDWLADQPAPDFDPDGGPALELDADADDSGAWGSPMSYADDYPVPF